MELGNQLILIGAGLVLLSIFAGLVSSRIGAPLLLVFLVLGMLAGEDGPGGLQFDNYALAYLFGSIALAIILFDGGMRTSYRNFRTALAPALLLATLGVLITAAITGVAAHLLLPLDWRQSFLIGAVVGSTDAAAVFFLLHLHGRGLRDRVNRILEVESGLNDPMAIFLTIAAVELILTPDAGTLTTDAAENLFGMFVLQLAGGAAAGAAGGFVLVYLINRLPLAAGLYPIFTTAGALVIFAATQVFGASGFLAIYLTGLIVGNRRHKAMLLIGRFQEGLSWLCQIGMFLMLGLLVQPSALVPILLPALGIAAALILVSRPAAVWLLLLPFDYTRRETAFIAWAGLRGAVPIFLGTIPVVAGLAHGETVFGVTYVVVLTSLVVQGWTAAMMARRLDLNLPPRPAPPRRTDIDLPGESDRDMAAYTVYPTSMAARRRIDRLPFPDRVEIVSVMREGMMQNRETLTRLAPGDFVLLIAPNDQMARLDRLFAPGAARPTRSAPEELIGEFVFAGDTPVGIIADQYGFHVPASERALPIGAFIARHLLRRPAAGRRLALGDVDLVVRTIENDRITRVSLDIGPQPSFTRSLATLRLRVDGLLRPALSRLHRRIAKRRVRRDKED